MASNKHQKLHSLSQFKRSQPLIRNLQILVFICVFSLIILWGPSWVTTNIKSWRLILSTSISNMLSLYINRNLMFLVCNTIIVFVTRGFGYIGFARPAAEDIYGEYMERSGARHQPEAVVLERNGSVEGERRMVIITESLENVEEEEEEDNRHLHHQPRHYLRRHDHGHQHQHHHGHHHSRLHQNQQQQKKQRRREEQQKQLKRRQEQQQQRQKQLQQQQLLLLRQQEQQLEQQQQVLLLLRRQEQRRQRRQQQEQRWQQQQLLLLQQQEEEDGPLVKEASDETFDNFIKTMKERMIMENRQLLLTY